MHNHICIIYTIYTYIAVVVAEEEIVSQSSVDIIVFILP